MLDRNDPFWLLSGWPLEWCVIPGWKNHWSAVAQFLVWGPGVWQSLFRAAYSSLRFAKLRKQSEWSAVSPYVCPAALPGPFAETSEQRVSMIEKIKARLGVKPGLVSELPCRGICPVCYFLFVVSRESCKKALNFSVVAGPGLTWNRARLLQMGLSLWWLSGCDGFSILCAFLCSTRPGTTSHCAAPAVMKTPRYWPRGCDHLAQPGMAAKLRGNRLQKRPPSARLRGELCGWTSWCKDFAMPSLMPRAVSSLIPACRGGCQRVSWAGPGKNCAACGRTCDFLKFDMEATLQ